MGLLSYVYGIIFPFTMITSVVWIHELFPLVIPLQKTRETIEQKHIELTDITAVARINNRRRNTPKTLPKPVSTSYNDGAARHCTCQAFDTVNHAHLVGDIDGINILVIKRWFKRCIRGLYTFVEFWNSTPSRRLFEIRDSSGHSVISPFQHLHEKYASVCYNNNIPADYIIRFKVVLVRDPIFFFPFCSK